MATSEVNGTTDCSEKCQSLIARSFEIHEQFLEKEANLLKKLKELEMKVKEQKDKLGELREYQKEMEMKEREEDAATDSLKHEMKLLKDKNHKLENKRELLKNKIEGLKNFQPSAEDTANLQLCRLKYQLYKDMTGVRWDYKANAPQGYVVNKKTHYVKPFSQESPNEDKLWEEIAKASTADWSAFSCE
ncbi:uncharacterized protein LOC124718932 [Schistocerca piceifrons]|uniref:uncharacterized protein LOC124718932 n=1 Tax=Schistocerca piceifrons TaxID=274613 RepID=UPI001F5F5642|nr:uncharacterized protein LOC124718932 [Schistocerca piceifrons]